MLREYYRGLSRGFRGGVGKGIGWLRLGLRRSVKTGIEKHFRTNVGEGLGFSWEGLGGFRQAPEGNCIVAGIGSC